MRQVRLKPACVSPALSLLGLLFFSPPALAHDEDAPDDRGTRRVDYDVKKGRSPQHAAFEFRIGPYTPDVDSEFNGGATPYEDSFGTKPSVSPGVEIDWQAIRIPYFGSLGPGIGWHWFRKKGIAEFTDGTAGSAHPHFLRVMPMYGVAVLRVDVLSRELSIPLVPYVKGGFAWAFWKSKDAGEMSETEDGEKAKGLETGYQGQVGVMLLINQLAPQMAIDMDNSSGINNAYLFLEGWASNINSFGTGMQVGAVTWTAGLALEF